MSCNCNVMQSSMQRLWAQRPWPQQKGAGEEPPASPGTPQQATGRGNEEEGREGFGRSGKESFIPAGPPSKPGLEARESTALCPTGLLGSRCRAGPQGCQTSPTRIAIIWKWSEIPFLPNSGGDFSAFQRAVFHHEEVVMSLAFLIPL